MGAERDALTKFLLPRLRRLCSARDVQLRCIDLRWGVTATQAEMSASLLLCLRELERSQLVLGMLGERCENPLPLEFGVCAAKDPPPLRRPRPPLSRCTPLSHLPRTSGA